MFNASAYHSKSQFLWLVITEFGMPCFHLFEPIFSFTFKFFNDATFNKKHFDSNIFVHLWLFVLLISTVLIYRKVDKYRVNSHTDLGAQWCFLFYALSCLYSLQPSSSLVHFSFHFVIISVILL